MPVFDWYQGTIPNPLNDVLDVLSGLGPELFLSHDQGMHGYRSAAVLGNSSLGPVARVLYGGSHQYPHAVLSGEWAQPGSELIRAAFPIHSVSRVDVREDFSDRGAFDSIQDHLIAIAGQHRLKVGTAGDHLLTMKGRTTYLGAKSSPVQLRLYDKRAELLAGYATDGEREAAATALELPEDLARLEAQIRPEKKEAKVRFSTLEPMEALGCSKWMREVWKAVAGLDLTPVQVGRGYRQSDDERAASFMLAQYGGLLRRMKQTHGSWECVGLQLGYDLDKRAV